MSSSASLLGYLTTNLRWLLGGFVMFFMSSFGQTYFISLSFGDLRDAYSLSHGELGLLNTGLTLASALAVMSFGHWTDAFTVRRVLWIVLPMMALASFLLQATTLIPVLVVALFLLRFTGQGYMTHLAFTAVGRWFHATRGRAISITSMGLNVGQALLPMAFVLCAGWIGWRLSWIGIAVLILLATPVLAVLNGKERTVESSAPKTDGTSSSSWTRRDVLRDPAFYGVVLAIMPLALIGNTIFFHQVHLVDTRGWDLAQFTAAYPVMAMLTVVFAFLSGALIDKYSAIAFLPVYLLPLGVGCMLLGYGQAQEIVFAFMLLLGISNGFSLTLYGAVWPEVYGTRHLGAIRSVATMLIIAASAIGPGLAGVLLDAGVDIGRVIFWLGMLCLAISVVSVPVCRTLARRRETTVSAD